MKPIAFAHRGGAAHRRENTLDAFRSAKERGATGIESDVRLSRDGIPILAHDPTVRRGVRRLTVARQDASDLAAHDIPRLADLYDVAGDLHFSLDVKTPDAGEASIDVARGAGPGALARLWLCSPDLNLLRSLRRADDHVRLVHSTARRVVFDALERHAATLADDRIDAFNLHRAEWSKGLVTLFQRFGVLAFAWDAQDTRHLRELVAMGVDALYSDDVDLMVGVVAEWSLD